MTRCYGIGSLRIRAEKYKHNCRFIQIRRQIRNICNSALVKVMAFKLAKRFIVALAALILLLTTVKCYKQQSSELYTAQESHHERSYEGNHEDKRQQNFCAVTNPTSGSYIDLSQLSSTPNRSGDDNNKNHPHESKTRWLVRGWGYGTNFTLGICSSPVTDKEQAQLTNTTGAFYTDEHERLVSIGDFSTSPQLLGNKKLTMKYDNGSMCPNGKDRKSTLLNFVCDREISSEAQISYIGSMHDCSYFFEVRSVYACPTSNKTHEVNVLGIFVGIFAVFFIVEFAGRRWLYEKMKNHFDSKNNILPNTTPVRPRWEFIERESALNSTLKRAGRLAIGLFGAAASLAYRLTSRNISRGGRGTIRLNSSAVPSSGSQDSFTRDIEQQNNIIDSLEVVSRESISSLEGRRD